MKTILLVNGFDLSMLNGNPTVRFQKMTLEEVKKGIAEYKPVSTIVSAEFAELLSKELGIYITPSIRKPEMNFNTSLLIADIKTKSGGKPRIVLGELQKDLVIEWWFAYETLPAD